jgi:hypothetical protein
MRYNKTKKLAAKGGQMLVVAVFVLLVFTVLGLAIASMLSNESYSAVQNLNGIRAINIAEGGLRFTVATSLAADSDFSDNANFGPVNLGAGSFSVVYLQPKNKNSCTVEVIGSVNGVTRTVLTNIKKGGSGLGAIAGDYVLFWGGTGTGNSSVGNNCTVTGDILVNNNLYLNGAVVNGTVEATGTITGSQNVSGSVETHIPVPTGQPTLDTSSYDAQIAYANAHPTYVGYTPFSGSLAPGIYYVQGDVDLGSLTLTGVTTIVATGTINVDNNSQIGDNLTVIAGGDINIHNQDTIGTHGLWYSRTGINMGNSGDISTATVGSGTAFITPGNINIQNSPASNPTDFQGFMFAGGTINAGNNLAFSGLMSCNNANLGNNVSLTLNQAAVTSAPTPGIIASAMGLGNLFQSEGWGEVY